MNYIQIGWWHYNCLYVWATYSKECKNRFKHDYLIKYQSVYLRDNVPKPQHNHVVQSYKTGNMIAVKVAMWADMLKCKIKFLIYTFISLLFITLLYIKNIKNLGSSDSAVVGHTLRSLLVPVSNPNMDSIYFQLYH